MYIVDFSIDSTCEFKLYKKSVFTFLLRVLQMEILRYKIRIDKFTLKK